MIINLSPFEKDRMIPDDLGKTEMGRDMLAQDYVLKQLTASLIYPERSLGKAFWDQVYARAQKQFGSIDIPVDAFNKVWIVADQAKVLERNNAAYVLGAHLKVMLETDYLATSTNAMPTPQPSNVKATQVSTQTPNAPNATNESNKIAKDVLREIVIPILEKEVNEGRNFAMLRQMFYSMIVATWYKKAVKGALLNDVYTDQSRTSGVLADDQAAKDQIYEQYLQAFKKGVFDYIKEDMDTVSQQSIPRKYFSGGLKLNVAAGYTGVGSPSGTEAQLMSVPGQAAVVPAVITLAGRSGSLVRRATNLALLMLQLAVAGDIFGAVSPNALGKALQGAGRVSDSLEVADTMRDNRMPDLNKMDPAKFRSEYLFSVEKMQLLLKGKDAQKAYEAIRDNVSSGPDSGRTWASQQMRFMMKWELLRLVVEAGGLDQTAYLKDFVTDLLNELNQQDPVSRLQDYTKYLTKFFSWKELSTVLYAALVNPESPVDGVKWGAAIVAGIVKLSPAELRKFKQDVLPLLLEWRGVEARKALGMGDPSAKTPEASSTDAAGASKALRVVDGKVQFLKTQTVSLALSEISKLLEIINHQAENKGLLEYASTSSTAGVVFSALAVALGFKIMETSNRAYINGEQGLMYKYWLEFSGDRSLAINRVRAWLLTQRMTILKQGTASLVFPVGREVLPSELEDLFIQWNIQNGGLLKGVEFHDKIVHFGKIEIGKGPVVNVIEGRETSADRERMTIYSASVRKLSDGIHITSMRDTSWVDDNLQRHRNETYVEVLWKQRGSPGAYLMSRKVGNEPRDITGFGVVGALKSIDTMGENFIIRTGDNVNDGPGTLLMPGLLLESETSPNIDNMDLKEPSIWGPVQVQDGRVIFSTVLAERSVEDVRSDIDMILQQIVLRPDLNKAKLFGQNKVYSLVVDSTRDTLPIYSVLAEFLGGNATHDNISKNNPDADKGYDMTYRYGMSFQLDMSNDWLVTRASELLSAMKSAITGDDKAQNDNLAPADASALPPGGISLNGQKMDIDLAKDGNGIEMKFDPAMVAEFRRGDLPGVQGIILRVIPLASPFQLLGMPTPADGTSVAHS
ncbi:MAG: DHH family phosphoesterase [Candidatus Omnitrophica bacterium]|nr:DHH family phosphoesterase [Candidatus Omnitrophota bacterium]